MTREKSRFEGSCDACGRPTARASELRWHSQLGAFVHAACQHVKLSPEFLRKRDHFKRVDRKLWRAVAVKVMRYACDDAKERGLRPIGPSRAWEGWYDRQPGEIRHLVCASAASVARVACAVAEVSPELCTCADGLCDRHWGRKRDA